MDSSHCPMYRCLIHRSHFLRNEDIKALRLLLQMRLTNDRFPRLLRGGHCTKFSPGSACPLCNSGAFDSLAHFVLDCPVLAGYRPISIARVASYPGPETARLANVLNTRPCTWTSSPLCTSPPGFANWPISFNAHNCLLAVLIFVLLGSAYAGCGFLYGTGFPMLLT